MSPEFDFEELKAADRFPSPPGVALAVLQLVEQEDSDLEELARLIQADPALSARLLRFVNSPAIAPRRPIVAVKDAVGRIGMNGVRNLVLGLSLVGHYRTGKCEGFDYQRFWAGSLALGVAASLLVGHMRLAAAEEIFTVGLLGDIGRLALATAWPKPYSECLQAAGDDPEALITLERSRFAVDHRQLTTLLLEDWHLPEVFIDALARSREKPIEGDDRPARLARLFRAASVIGHWCLTPEDRRASLSDHPAITALDLDLDWEEFPVQVEKEWHDWGKLIEIPTRFPKRRADTPPKKPAEMPLPGLDILLVDDDAMLLLRLAKQLGKAGHRVATCKDGKSALETILKEPPQVVITDWHMEPMDGLTLCRALRDSPIGDQLFLIMLTASESEDDLVRAFDAGIDDYVTKPVSLRVLLARIRAAQRIVSLTEALNAEHAKLEQRAQELALMNRKLAQIANTDLLTGLPNRRYALKRLEQELLESRRSSLSLSVLLVDLDHFKHINDRYGHDVGDRVLAHAAGVMRRTVRGSDIVCRFGGEEFLVVAPNTDLKAAIQLGERIRTALERTPPKELQHPVTASIGVATARPGDGEAKLLRRADEALYESKGAGRNRVMAAA